MGRRKEFFEKRNWSIKMVEELRKERGKRKYERRATKGEEIGKKKELEIK